MIKGIWYSILKFIIGIVIFVFLSIFTVDILVVNTFGNENFYYESFSKANYSFSSLGSDLLPQNATPEMRAEFGDDFEVFVIDSIMYSLSIKESLEFNIDSKKYISMLPEQLPLEYEQEMISQIDEITAQFESMIKERVKPIREGTKIMLLLMWPALIIAILGFLAFFLLTFNLKETLKWAGATLFIPNIIILIMILIAQRTINLENFMSVGMETGAIALLGVMVSTLFYFLFIICISYAILGAVLYIVSVFVKDKS